MAEAVKIFKQLMEDQKRWADANEAMTVPAARRQWTETIGELVNTVKNWLTTEGLDSLVDVNSATFSDSVLGEYQADRLVITTPLGLEITLAPLSAPYLDFRGTAEIHSGDKFISLVHTPDGWKLYDQQHEHLVEFDKDKFYGILDWLARSVRGKLITDEA